MNSVRPVVFWWASPCRAITPVFRELADLWCRPTTVIACGSLSKSRQAMEWSLPDLGSASLVTNQKGMSEEKARQFVRDNSGAFHVFGGYQKSRGPLASAICTCISDSVPYGIMSEAPLNMFDGPRRLLKSIYLQMILPRRVARVVQNARFVANLSGREKESLIRVGWPEEKIVPFGYYPELDYSGGSSQSIYADIICVGLLEHFKGVDILLRAVSEARRLGSHYKVTVTGEGARKKHLLRLAKELAIDDLVEFCGMVPREELEQRWRGARVLVAPGRYEPWGIRINESILKGVPVICSDGLGACELIRESNGGKVFSSGNWRELTRNIMELLDDDMCLVHCRENAKEYASVISPLKAAERLRGIIDQAIDG